MAEEVRVRKQRCARVVFVERARVFFNFRHARESLTRDRHQSVFCAAEREERRVWHAKQPYREHHYISYSWLSEDSNDDIYILSSITKQSY